MELFKFKSSSEGFCFFWKKIGKKWGFAKLCQPLSMAFRLRPAANPYGCPPRKDCWQCDLNLDGLDKMSEPCQLNHLGSNLNLLLKLHFYPNKNN